jgi:CHRD domain
MSKISRRRLRLTAAAAGTGVIAVAAWATTAHAGPLDAAAAAMKSSPVSDQISIQVRLAATPQGTVTFGRDRLGTIDVAVHAFGLTPGSSHTVELVNGQGRVVTTFWPLTANSTGQADKTLDSGYKGSLGPWRAVITNGPAGGPVSAEPIAQSPRYVIGGLRTYRLTAVEDAPDGRSYGTPQGSAVITYHPSARTISVTVNASGFTPGPHAAHIHDGSCVSQGPVQYMLTDFTANADGRIVDQTRVVTNVTVPLAASGWYFNLHQGNSGDILANGSPTINFRPLLCGDILP